MAKDDDKKDDPIIIVGDVRKGSDLDKLLKKPSN